MNLKLEHYEFNEREQRQRKEDMDMTTVINLATGEEQVFCLAPHDALVSAYILAVFGAARLTDSATRYAVETMIQRSASGKTIAINDFCAISQ